MEEEKEIILTNLERVWDNHNAIINNLLNYVINWYNLSEEGKKTAIFQMKNSLLDHNVDFDVEMGKLMDQIENLNTSYAVELDYIPYVPSFEINENCKKTMQKKHEEKHANGKCICDRNFGKDINK
jgi:hypothetical protein